MAVQPDKRPLEKQLAERGADLVIVAEAGPYVLCRMRRDEHPAVYYMRDRRPGERLRRTVSKSPMWQWSAGEGFDHFETAEAAFRAWVAAQG